MRDLKQEKAWAQAIASGGPFMIDDIRAYSNLHGLDLVMVWPTYNVYEWREKETKTMKNDPRERGFNYGQPIPVAESLNECDLAYYGTVKLASDTVREMANRISNASMKLDNAIRNVRLSCDLIEQRQHFKKLRTALETCVAEVKRAEALAEVERKACEVSFTGQPSPGSKVRYPVDSFDGSGIMI